MTQILILYFQQTGQAILSIKKENKSLNKIVWLYKIEKDQLKWNVKSNHQSTPQRSGMCPGEEWRVTISHQVTTSSEDVNVKTSHCKTQWCSKSRSFYMGKQFKDHKGI